MASIYKTYVTLEEYQKVIKYFNRRLKRKMKKELGYVINIPKYTIKDFENIVSKILWNTSSLTDLWLAKNIKLDIIQERLKLQYPENWIGFVVDLDFNKVGFIKSITYNNTCVQPYKIKPHHDINLIKVKPYYDLICFGTTLFNKILYSSLGLISGREVYEMDDDDSIGVEFELFGKLFRIDKNKKDIKYYLLEVEENDIVSKEVSWMFLDLEDDYLAKKKKYKKFNKFLPNYSIINNPKLKRRYFKKPERVIFSEEYCCYDALAYKQYNPKYYNRYLSMSVPEHINIFLKN